MSYTVRPASPPAAAFTRRGRPGGAGNIHQFQLHATRGPVPMDRQVMATENWFSQQPDRGGWGSSADFVVGPDSRVAGEVVIVSFGDPFRTFGSWSAGYGSFGASREWGAAEVGIAIEIAQPDNDTPFTDETVDAVAWLCNDLNDKLDGLGLDPIPAVKLGYWDQLRDNPIPRGFLSHEDLANGIKLGKSDVGKMWDWDAFLAKIEDYEVDMSPPISNYTAGFAAWRKGVTPLAQEEAFDNYLLQIGRS